MKALILLLCLVLGQTYICDESQTLPSTSGILLSHNMDTPNYKDNMNCAFRISSNDSNKVVKVSRTNQAYI